MRSDTLVLTVLTVLACDATGRNPDLDASLQDLAADSSREYAARVGDGIGDPVEVRFAGDGRYVVVLDKFAPHLRLFTADGTLLWTGAGSGGGPRELSDAQVLGTRGNEVIAVQRGGRLSRWRIDNDSLSFVGAIPLSPTLAPMGLVPGCSGDWLLYARNDQQFVVVEGQPVAPTIEYLHTLEIRGDSVVTSPLWSDARDIGAVFGYGHSAALLSRYNNRVAIWHRSNGWGAGRILELDCQGRIVSEFPEISLVTGDSIPVKIPRTKALQWTSGVAATPQGIVLAIHRYTSPGSTNEPVSEWRTEIFGIADGFVGSTILGGQWQIMDFVAPNTLMLATDYPVPHFIRLPADTVMAYLQETDSH